MLGTVLRAVSVISSRVVHGGRCGNRHGYSRGLGHCSRLEVTKPRLELIMFEKVKSGLRAVGAKGLAVASAVGAVVLGASPAFAQTGPTFDTTNIVATITAVGAAAAVVGAAYVAMRIGVRAWKWLTGAA